MRHLSFILAAALCCAARSASAEQLTLTTYYPAPYGGYVSILTTMDTMLSRDGGTATVGKAGDTSDKLTVHGNTKVKDLYLSNTGDVFVKLPRPPAGRTLAWESMLIGTEIDQYQATGDYTGSAHGDTCDGNVNGAYTCPNGLKRTCVDVQKSQDQSCVWGGWNKKAGGVSDSCNSNNQPYGTCDKTCTDVDCTDWLGNNCINRSWRSITFTPGKYKDVNVTCTTTETAMVLMAK